MKKKSIHSVLFILALFAASLGACAPKNGSVVVKIGTQPWIGYGPWWIAKEEGLFEKHNISVELVDFVEDKEVNPAFASGDMQAANLATHTAIKLYAAGLDMKLVLLEDASYQADAVIAPHSVTSIANLKGKKVAYEEGATSDLLINYALAQNGMSLKDITPVFMPASDAGPALIAGQVNAAVTYEPYITTALGGGDGDLHLLYTAAERPGLISDVFVVSGAFAKAHPDTVKALVQIWGEALAYYNSNPEDAKAIIANAVGSSPADLQAAFDGVKFYDVAANQKELAGGAFMDTLKDVADTAKSIGLLESIPDLNGLVDASYLK